MDAGLLDTLVKLASLGASGVCIFAIFWIGWLILRLPAGKDPERHREAEIKTKDAANALAAVLKSKEAYNLRHPSDEIQAHIDLLKPFLATMGVAYEAGD